MLDWLSFTLRYAGLATLFATAIGIPLAWLLAKSAFVGRQALDAFANLPFALPPAVLCYYLLKPEHFSWNVALALSTVYTLPLVVSIARAGFEAAGRNFENAARALGAAEFRIFWRIALPLACRALLAATLAAFARAFVDFGIAAMLTKSAFAAGPVLLTALLAWSTFYAASRLRHGRAWA